MMLQVHYFSVNPCIPKLSLALNARQWTKIYVVFHHSHFSLIISPWSEKNGQCNYRIFKGAKLSLRSPCFPALSCVAPLHVAQNGFISSLYGEGVCLPYDGAADLRETQSWYKTAGRLEDSFSSVRAGEDATYKESSLNGKEWVCLPYDSVGDLRETHSWYKTVGRLKDRLILF